MKAVLREKFLMWNACISREEKSKLSNLSLRLRKLQKSEQIKSKVSGRKAILKIRAEDFPGGAVVKNLPANAEDTGSSPGPGKSHVLQSN